MSRTRFTLRQPFLVALALGCLACAPIAEDVTTHLADRQPEGVASATVFSGDLALFRQCLQQRGGRCPTPTTVNAPLPFSRDRSPITPAQAGLGVESKASLAELPQSDPAHDAAAVLAHPLIQKVVDLHNQLRGNVPASHTSKVESVRSGASTSRLVLSTSVGEVSGLVNAVQRSISSAGWHALVEATRPTAGGSSAAVRDHRTAQYVHAYVEAYFRSGRFIEIDFSLDSETARQKLLEDLCGSATSAASPCQEEAARLFSTYASLSKGGTRALVPVSSLGFVSRDGTYHAQFPEFRLDLDPTARRFLRGNWSTNGQSSDQRYLAMGTALLRVLIEAIFDAHEGLPAVSGATGLGVDGSIALPTMDLSTGPISSQDLAHMITLNNRVESGVGILIDRVVRGIGVLSLDNEAVEQSIVTLIAATVRKAAEKATWCWYACDLDIQLAQAEEKAAQEARAAAEHIELELRLAPSS